MLWMQRKTSEGGKMIDEDNKRILKMKFDFFNERSFDSLYPNFCEAVNKFRREEDLALLAIPTLLTVLLGDALNQSYDLINSEKDKIHADFFLAQYEGTLKKLNDFIQEKQNEKI